MVEAPLPAGALVNDWPLPDGSVALTYTLRPGAPYMDSTAAIAFQAAFNGAARAVESYGVPALHNVGSTVEETPCSEDNADGCGIGNGDGDPGTEQNGGGLPIPQIPVPGTPDQGPIDGGGGGGGDHAPQPDPAGAPADPAPAQDMQVVVIHGAPDPVNTITTIQASYNGLWGVPGPAQLQQLASNDPNKKCVDGGIAIVCIWGKRAPTGYDDPQLPGRTPWFPQAMCNWWHIFCTEGQEQQPSDNDRGRDASMSGKTKAELDQICVNINKVEIDVCKANFPGWRNRQFREYKVCEQEANDRMFACFRTADEVTDFGRHPAP